MIEWIMMAAFIGGLGLAVWKLYLFFPQTPLPDDDTTPEAVNELVKIMLKCHREGMNVQELFETMIQHPDFDRERYWRFNENRLRHLIDHYRLSYPDFRH